MALYGLRVKDANGNITLDITDRITRFRYSHEAAIREDGSANLADINGLQSIEFSIGLDPLYRGASHKVWRNGTTIHWQHSCEGAEWWHPAPVPSLIFCFLYT